MNAIRQNFRQWWQPPRRVVDREEERSVTFLELFYDLVYVVLVAELAHTLAGDVSLAGIGRFDYAVRFYQLKHDSVADYRHFALNGSHFLRLQGLDC